MLALNFNSPGTNKKRGTNVPLVCLVFPVFAPLIFAIVGFLAFNSPSNWIGNSPTLANLDLLFHVEISMSQL